MVTAPDTRDVVLVTSACGELDPGARIVAAAERGGGWGVLDLALGDGAALSALSRAASWTRQPIGVRVPAGCRATPERIDEAGRGRVGLVVVSPDTPWDLARVTSRYRVLAEVTSLDEARAMAGAGVHGLIARGMEAGGRVSELSSFVLVQHLVADDELHLPVWVAGGVGPHTAGACVVGGAAGVVLDSQVALMPESELPEDVLSLLRHLDGSETLLVGRDRGIRRGGLKDPESELFPIGQDGWLAAVFAQRWRDTTAAVRGVRESIRSAVTDHDAADVLAPGGPLAVSLGTRLPVAQGPMTRVSDEAGFAAAVAAGGGLPFIALALASADRTRRMLEATARRLGDRPWGVGILGFAPEDVRAAQLAVVRELRPRYAIVAGGRPPQAKALEEQGISTFLHVPSPGLLRQFLRAGARKFIFEGAECGGHVGPRASFPLWEAQLLALQEFLADAPEQAPEVQVFFAGGVHDARSAAMVAATAGPLTRRGVRVGVLMGTAYLFTREAVEHGAVTSRFQREALAANRTALLETAPGHATRCLHTPYVDDFHRLRVELESSGVENRQVWERLESLNMGRLRLASKGLRRDGDALVTVDDATQLAEGLYMAGQVAVLRDRTVTVGQLHAQVTQEARRFHQQRTAELAADVVDAPERPARAPAPVDVAIVGMACMLPGSPDLDSFWRTVLSGADAVTEVPPHRWDVETYYAPHVPPGQAGRYSVSKWGGFLDPVPFDAIGYGIPPAALSSIDPTQLLALEVSHRALRDAGYPYDAPGVDHSRTGVVFGEEAGSDMVYAQNLRTMLPAYLGDLPKELEDLLPTVTEDSFPGVLGNVTAGRVANRLDLGGPNFTVDAACASSLAALDAACKELTSGDSDLMICGGVDLHNTINDYLMFSSARALSPTGRCRSFDSGGDGIALSEGVACVVLKRLVDAERDGDRIYAVIRGVGAASDGRALGLTAPRPEGQRRAFDRAYRQAGISPREVGLIEAHATGTALGDRTELGALTDLFVDAGAEPARCAIGSVKSQIGHTKCAAGLAGVIKAALAVYGGVKPPTIHLERPTPAWDPDRSPFAFHTEARPWAAPAQRRVAGISAFGFGGTNYHVVLAAYPHAPEPRHTQRVWPAELFCFHGVDREAAYQSIRVLAASLDETDHCGRRRPLADLAAACAQQARPGPVRVAVVARDLDELATLVGRALAGDHDPARGLVQPAHPAEVETGEVAFLFPGQGSQRPGALAELFVTFPELRQYLDFDPEITELLFPPAAFDPEHRRAQEERLRDTRAAQPALGITALAVDHLLRRVGVRPDTTAGHSYGELVALCVAGAVDPDTLVALSRARAAAILDACGDDPGTMAAVGASPERVHRVLADAGLASDVVAANHNAPQQIVISGPTPAVEAAVAALRGAGITARALPVACAFHSPVVAGGVARFADVLAGYPIRPPKLPVWSNLTAARYPGDTGSLCHHLAEQIGAPVRFVEQIEAMYASGVRTFVEAGPGHVLTSLVRAVLGDRPHLAVATEPSTTEGLRGFLVTLGELACAGLPVRVGWLFRDRVSPATPTSVVRRPIWTVDGQLVRDQHGNTLPGGMTPPRRIKDLSMTSAPHANGGQDGHGDLLREFLLTSREMLHVQRDVLLAYLGDGSQGRLVWQPAERPTPRAVPAGSTVVPAAIGPTAPSDSAPTEASVPEFAAAVAMPATVSVPPAPDPVPPVSVQPAPVSAQPVSVPPAPVSAPSTVPVSRMPDPVPVIESPVPAAVGAALASRIQETVLGVISERTGYPAELIELDLDLEADLSIDSIKRAEVAGELALRLELSDTGDVGELDELVGARTVEAMVDVLAQLMGGRTTGGTATAVAAGPQEHSPHEHPVVAPKRLVAQSVPLPGSGPAPVGLSGTRLLLTGGGAVSAALGALLTEHGATGVVGTVEPESAGQLHRLDGVVVLDGLDPHGPPLLPRAFPFLKQALLAAPRWLLAVAPATGTERVDGLRGLFRTMAREYPQVAIRLVEVDVTADPNQLAGQIVEELRAGDTAPVVTRRGSDRYETRFSPAGLGLVATGGAGPADDGVAEARALGLGPESVVVMVGGARGITPWFARTLASASRCRIDLMGRTPLPVGAEAPDVAAAGDKATLRAALARRGARSTAEIERSATAILAGREVTATLAQLRGLGSEVNYHTLDVRDAEATRKQLDAIHRHHGRIDGLLYVAGVIEDKLIADKDPESFRRVYDTKVEGARAVLRGLDDLPTKPGFVVLFGSVAAAYGSRGQGDYAAANDALDRLGTRWAARTGNRCLTIHWGPLAPPAGSAGMVSEELMREYARLGVDLMDPDESALALLRELAWGDPANTSVIYSPSTW